MPDPFRTEKVRKKHGIPHQSENRRSISVIGLGSSYLSETPEQEAMETLEMAYENGINYIDMAAGAAKCFEYYGKSFASRRKNMFYQIHFGADYATGEYGWTTSVEKIKRSIDWQLKTLRTDYIDYGFIHCLDKDSDWNSYRKDGVLDHLLKMKEEGVVRHIGLSSHTPLWQKLHWIPDLWIC